MYHWVLNHKVQKQTIPEDIIVRDNHVLNIVIIYVCSFQVYRFNSNKL